MENQFAALAQNADGKTSEQQLQDEIAGSDVALTFVVQGQTEPFHQQTFKTGQTFEWVKHKVSLALECKYQDILLLNNGKRIPEPFCLVDMNINTATTLEVQILEGAEIGLDKVKLAVAEEIANQAPEEDNGKEEEK